MNSRETNLQMLKQASLSMNRANNKVSHQKPKLKRNNIKWYIKSKQETHNPTKLMQIPILVLKTEIKIKMWENIAGIFIFWFWTKWDG